MMQCECGGRGGRCVEQRHSSGTRAAVRRPGGSAPTFTSPRTSLHTLSPGTAESVPLAKEPPLESLRREAGAGGGVELSAACGSKAGSGGRELLRPGDARKQAFPPLDTSLHSVQPTAEKPPRTARRRSRPAPAAAAAPRPACGRRPPACAPAGPAAPPGACELSRGRGQEGLSWRARGLGAPTQRPGRGSVRPCTPQPRATSEPTHGLLNLQHSKNAAKWGIPAGVSRPPPTCACLSARAASPPPGRPTSPPACLHGKAQRANRSPCEAKR